MTKANPGKPGTQSHGPRSLATPFSDATKDSQDRGSADQAAAKPVFFIEAIMTRALGHRLAISATLVLGVALVLECTNEPGPFAPAPVASVTVAPPTPTVGVGETVQLTATTKDANGNVLAGRVVTWASSNTAVATVSPTGLVTGVAEGQSTITATSEGQSGTAALTVIPPVASVTVAPAPATVVVGQTLQLTATTKDANGNVLTGRVVTWETSNTGVATVSPAGLVTGVTPGPATITATSETKSGTAAITVVNLVFAGISSGGSHTCGVTTSGAAYCWGSNSSGQLGGPPSAACSIDYYGNGVPCSVIPLAVAGGLTFAAVSAGNVHTCGVTTGGAAYCWGDNTQGQLGNGSTASSGTPVPVAGTPTFAAGGPRQFFPCGVDASGGPNRWGVCGRWALGKRNATRR